MTTTRPVPGSTVLGYPWTDPYHTTGTSRTDRADAAARARRDIWTRLRDAGLGRVPGSTFAFRDPVLDTALAVGAIPERFAGIADPLECGLAMAGSCASARWSGTDRHHVVPEIGPRTRLAPVSRRAVHEFREALRAGVTTRPVLVGPLTFLLRAVPPADAPEGFRPLSLLGPLVEVYRDVLLELAEAGVSWVQFDEPALSAPSGDRTAGELAALRTAYDRLAGAPRRPRILVANYRGALGPALPVLAGTYVEGLALDLVDGASDLDGIEDVRGLDRKLLVAGVVDGRDAGRTDPDAALAAVRRLAGVGDRVWVSASCPVPDGAGDPARTVDEVVRLARAVREGRDAVAVAG